MRGLRGWVKTGSRPTVSQQSQPELGFPYRTHAPPCSATRFLVGKVSVEIQVWQRITEFSTLKSSWGAELGWHPHGPGSFRRCPKEQGRGEGNPLTHGPPATQLGGGFNLENRGSQLSPMVSPQVWSKQVEWSQWSGISVIPKPGGTLKCKRPEKEREKKKKKSQFPLHTNWTKNYGGKPKQLCF